MQESELAFFRYSFFKQGRKIDSLALHPDQDLRLTNRRFSSRFETNTGINKVAQESRNASKRPLEVNILPYFPLLGKIIEVNALACFSLMLFSIKGNAAPYFPLSTRKKLRVNGGSIFPDSIKGI